MLRLFRRIPSDNADNELAMTITVDDASYAVSKTKGSPVCGLSAAAAASCGRLTTTQLTPVSELPSALSALERTRSALRVGARLRIVCVVRLYSSMR